MRRSQPQRRFRLIQHRRDCDDLGLGGLRRPGLYLREPCWEQRSDDLIAGQAAIR